MTNELRAAAEAAKRLADEALTFGPRLELFDAVVEISRVLSAALAAAPSTSPAAAALAAAVDDSLGLVTLPPIRVDRATHASLMEAAKSRGVILQALVRERLAPYATPSAAAAVAGEPNRAKTNAINLAHLRQVMARWHEQACELGFDGVADVLASIAAEQVGRWVPLKPTAEMVLALLNAPEIEDARSDIESMWAAMLAAAPHHSPSAAEQTGRAALAEAHARGLISGLEIGIEQGASSAPSASPAEAPADQSPDDLRARFDAWLKTTPDWAPEYEQHRAWVELFAWWAVHALAAHAQPVAPAGQAAARVQGEDAFLDSPFNACMYREQCKALIRPAPAVERGVAEEREERA